MSIPAKTPTPRPHADEDLRMPVGPPPAGDPAEPVGRIANPQGLRPGDVEVFAADEAGRRPAGCAYLGRVDRPADLYYRVRGVRRPGPRPPLRVRPGPGPPSPGRPRSG